ncbi:MAG: xanthine dehydrogenase family protein subunit M [Pseudomonadota bacterium]
MRLPKFEYFEPETLEDALRLLAEWRERACVLAGGTDVLVKMRNGRLKPGAVIALERISSLNGIGFDSSKGLTIGAGAKLSDVASHPDILRYYPAIARAARVMANVQVRNMGTIGGNLCNAAPSAENAPPLVVLGAVVTAASLEEERRIILDDFFTGPGLTVLKPEEIMTSILVPAPRAKSGSSYQRISARCGVDIAAVSVAAMVRMEGNVLKEVRIALGAVAPVPMRAFKTEAFLLEKNWTPELLKEAARMSADESRPISDVRASSQYRRQMVAVLTLRALEEAHARAMTH